MKLIQLSTILVIFFGGIHISAQGQNVADSTIQGMAEFNCQCQDTISLRQNQKAIGQQLMDCFTKSMVVYLNKGELGANYLQDNKKLESLQYKVFNYLLRYCLKTRQINDKSKGIPVPQDSVSNQLFIPDKFLTGHKLKKVQTTTHMRVWNAVKHPHIQRLVDIRWVFDTPEEALRYHQAKLKENSENGRKVTLNDKVTDAQALRVFRESKRMEDMIKAMDLPQRQHCFLFVVKNVAFKIFVATDKTWYAKDLLFIVKKAVEQAKSQ
ncbi:hypothetical protein BKI52_39895 [marine bacterium AO1-C]|nr:hypothetical protein BKI52_39895 [marine bacterium AO1-C]